MVLKPEKKKTPKDFPQAGPDLRWWRDDRHEAFDRITAAM
jgi:hypothetical protein